MDSGATQLYIAPTTPHGPPDTSADTIKVGTANGQVETSSEKDTLLIPQLEADSPTNGYIIPSLTDTLIGVGHICDAKRTVIFKTKDVTVLSPEGKKILTGRREKKLLRLWHFALKPEDNSITDYKTTNQTTPVAHSAYELPSIEALVLFMHAASGSPVKSTWLKSIKKGNVETWPGLMYTNTSKYCPHAVETIKGHMVQSSQGVRSTKKTKHQSRDN